MDKNKLAKIISNIIIEHNKILLDVLHSDGKEDLIKEVAEIIDNEYWKEIDELN